MTLIKIYQIAKNHTMNLLSVHDKLLCRLNSQTSQSSLVKLLIEKNKMKPTKQTKAPESWNDDT